MKTGNDNQLWNLLNAKNSAIEESDCLVAFGIGRVYDLCMERFPIRFDLLVDTSETVRASSRGHERGLTGDVQNPEVLSALDVSELVVLIFSAQGWDMEDQLIEVGVPRARIFNFVEFENFCDVLLEIPREAAFHALPSLVTESDVCIDVGANEGLYSIKMATLVDSTKGGKVHAVEPFSFTRKALIRNLDATGVEGVEVHPFALGSGSGEKFQRIFVPKVGSQVKGGSARLFPVGGVGQETKPQLLSTPSRSHRTMLTLALPSGLVLQGLSNYLRSWRWPRLISCLRAKSALSRLMWRDLSWRCCGAGKGCFGIVSQ